ncbi:unnamed protein product [marine sediment metagenome]|uniref:Methionyl/Valyl/Leucyl/Isoleucyl-tRNA synthetase anticodon-binding domain-containing protein n=1 Tax=marine sediment metagenome TaxID=412755 RepID=X0TJT4_9ZZZZ
MAPFVPFLTERIFLSMQENLNYKKEIKSIHLTNFPEFEDKLIEENILNEMDFVNDIIQDLKALREKVRIKNRQPIKEYLCYLKEDKHKIIIN